MGKKLTMEQVTERQKRARSKCNLYQPTKSDSTRCVHYGGEGICLHDREFLCVVWVDGARKPQIDEKHTQLRGVRRWLEAESQDEPTDHVVKESFLKLSRDGKTPPSARKKVVDKSELPDQPEPARQGRLKDRYDEGEPARRERRGKKGGSRDVYDLRGFGVEEENEERHILKNPDLLTEEAIDALTELGIEVTVKTARGVEVALVPQYTDQRRSELSYRDARTLVMVMQVFPGATVDEINRVARHAEGAE